MPSYKYIIAYLGQSRHKSPPPLDPRFVVAEPGDGAGVKNLRANLKTKDYKGMGEVVSSFFHVTGATDDKIQATPINSKSNFAGGFAINWGSLSTRQLIYDTISDTLIINHVPQDCSAREIAIMFMKGKFDKK